MHELNVPSPEGPILVEEKGRSFPTLVGWTFVILGVALFQSMLFAFWNPPEKAGRADTIFLLFALATNNAILAFFLLRKKLSDLYLEIPEAWADEPGLGPHRAFWRALGPKLLIAYLPFLTALPHLAVLMIAGRFQLPELGPGPVMTSLQIASLSGPILLCLLLAIRQCGAETKVTTKDALFMVLSVKAYIMFCAVFLLPMFLLFEHVLQRDAANPEMVAFVGTWYGQAILGVVIVAAVGITVVTYRWRVETMREELEYLRGRRAGRGSHADYAKLIHQ